jgi:hypothetical protein
MFDFDGQYRARFGSEREYVPRWLRMLLTYLKEVFLASIGATICGFILGMLILPPLEVSAPKWFTGIFGEPHFLLPILAACVFLYFNARRKRLAWPSLWVWILPALWLAYGLATENTYYPGRGSWRIYVWNNFFGSHCGFTECIGEWLYTCPFYTSVVYSIVAWIMRRKHPNSTKMSGNL